MRSLPIPFSRARARAALFCTLSLAALSAAPAGAQTAVRLFGVPRANAGGYLLEGTSVRLQSSSVNLRSFTGAMTEIRGTLAAAAPVPLVEVTSIAATDRVFAVTGDRIGSNLTLRLDAPLGIYYYYFFSFAEGFLPLEAYEPIASGTLFTDLALTCTGGWGVMATTWTADLAIPNDPRLIGARVLFQAAVHEFPGPLLYVNAVAVDFRR